MIFYVRDQKIFQVTNKIFQPRYWRKEVKDLPLVDAVSAMKRELSVEVSTSTQKDGKATKNAWPGLVFTKMWSYLSII